MIRIIFVPTGDGGFLHRDGEPVPYEKFGNLIRIIIVRTGDDGTKADGIRPYSVER